MPAEVPALDGADQAEPPGRGTDGPVTIRQFQGGQSNPYAPV